MISFEITKAKNGWIVRENTDGQGRHSINIGEVHVFTHEHEVADFIRERLKAVNK